MKVTYNEVVYDSQEEVDFMLWLESAKSLGYISSYEYQPEPIVLSLKATYEIEKKLKTKTKILSKTLFQPHVYTPDFLINFTELFFIDYKDVLFPEVLNVGSTLVYVDVKGTFNQNDAWRRFSIDQKWVYQKYGIYINKVIPEQFFKKTFVRDEVAFYKNNATKRIKRFADCRLLSELREERKNASIKLPD